MARSPILGALLLVGLAACSSDSKKKTTADSGAPPAPTFTNVYDLVIRGNGCTQSQCHGAIAAGGLDLSSKDAAYQHLVGVKAAGPCPEGGAGDSGSGDAGTSGLPPGFPGLPAPVCGCGWTGKTRVVKGDPTTSLLYEKLYGSPTCGDRMPQTGEPISNDQLALVEQWIKLGAKND